MPVSTRSSMKLEWAKASQVRVSPKASKIFSKSKAIMKAPSSNKFFKDDLQSLQKSKSRTKAIRKLPSSCVKFLEDEPVIRQEYKPM